MNKIAVIGAGSWGTTLATLLAEKGYDVRLWARREELANEIKLKRENIQYLPGAKIPQNLIADSSLERVMDGTTILINGIPSQFVRGVMGEVKKHFDNQIIVSLTKGIEHQTGRRMSEIIEDVIG